MKKRQLVAPFVFAACLFAQSAPTTSLSGTITDPSGAIIPSAVLELTNAGTHWSKKTEADGQGRYLFTLVPPGAYYLNISASGFGGVRQEGIRLDADVPGTVNVSLSVAGTATTVTIQADTAMVDTQSGTVRQVVGEDYIEQLPLQGRNAATLVYMAPGTVLGKGIDSGTYATNTDTIAVSANGAMGDQVSYKLDGSSHTDNLNNLNAGFPNPDALSQFTVETNNFDAEYGGAGGAVVNIVTKSGTNSLHGSAFDYLRNGDLNARNSSLPSRMPSSATNSAGRSEGRSSATRYSSSVRGNVRFSATSHTATRLLSPRPASGRATLPGRRRSRTR